MITFKKINLNHSYYIFNGIGNIDPNLLNINKIYARNIDSVIYEIQYIMMQSINNQNIDREIPLCLSFNNVDAYIIEENQNKYLIFALTGNNKEELDLYRKLWSDIEKQIKAINSGECNYIKRNSIEPIKYKKDFMKTRLDSHDDLLLNICIIHKFT